MANSYRKLVTIQTIDNIKPIENADSIELAVVLGWNVVVGKNDFEVGEKIIFFEIDSFLPLREPFMFLYNRCYTHNTLLGSGLRIKTMKLRGVFSQGLIMKYNTFLEKDLPIGTDLTEILGIRLFEKPDSGDDGFGNLKPYFHNYISKTDEIRVQTDPKFLVELKGKPYYITEKIDGTSVTIVRENGETHIYGRKNEYERDDTTLIWQIFNNLGVLNVFDNLTEDIFIQGELYGEGIQGNKLKIKGKDYRIFNIGNPKTGACYNYKDWNNILNRIDPLRVLKTVKLLEKGDNFNYTLEELLLKAQGNYDGAGKREGIVIRPQIETKREDLSRLSFKVLNNNYLLKE